MKMPKSLIIDPQFKNLIPPLQNTCSLKKISWPMAAATRSLSGAGRWSTATIAMRSVCGTVFPFL